MAANCAAEFWIKFKISFNEDLCGIVDCVEAENMYGLYQRDWKCDWEAHRLNTWTVTQDASRVEAVMVWFEVGVKTDAESVGPTHLNGQ